MPFTTVIGEPGFAMVKRCASCRNTLPKHKFMWVYDGRAHYLSMCADCRQNDARDSIHHPTLRIKK